jgi:beta-galactosidase
MGLVSQPSGKVAARICFPIVIAVVLGQFAAHLPASPKSAVPTPIVIRASVEAAPPQPIWFSTGGESPQGESLGVNSRYLLRDGKPWFPVMGEFQYSRYPESEWEEEILKMKSGGIEIISTYVFWIHHEEIQGEFDWTARRNLRRFIELCAKHRMYVWVRVGPWDHGECRNGGFPDWLLQQGPTRQIEPVYLQFVQRFYDQIGQQLKGLMWKDGGPVIGIQLENEYSERGPSKGADYLLALRKLALEAGLDAPFYTITGWDNAVVPASGVLPVFGGYEDAFWSRSLQALPPNANYFFMPIRRDEDVDDDLHSKRPDIDSLDSAYPYLTAEMGGGMELSYHRRPLIEADDIAAMDVTKLGSGVSLYGYYMFQGGTQPNGKLTTMQESQATGYPNDVPVKSYDFQAPLGEFGQMRPSFRAVKVFHLFLGDFGSSLAPMASYFPEEAPAGKSDTATPRVAARLKDGNGFLFINNYQRLYPLPARAHFQVKLQLASGSMEIPIRPVNVPGGAYMIWPVNLDLGAAILRYATVQPLCNLPGQNTYVFFAWPGISPELAIVDREGNSVEAPKAHVSHSDGVTYVSRIAPGSGSLVTIRTRKGSVTRLLVLTREQALNSWKANLDGEQRLVLSPADLYFDGDAMHLSANDPSLLHASFYPGWSHSPVGMRDLGSDGVFRDYAISPEPNTIQISASVEDLAKGDDPPPPRFSRGVPEVPDESAFEGAAKWKIRIPGSTVHAKLLLNIRYEGDISRLYAGGQLFDDNFYNGSVWQVGLWRIPPQELAQGLDLTILALRQDSPVYLPKGARPNFSGEAQIARLDSVQVVSEYDVERDLRHDP